MNIPTGHNLRVLYNNELLGFFFLSIIISPQIQHDGKIRVTQRANAYRQKKKNVTLNIYLEDCLISIA